MTSRYLHAYYAGDQFIDPSPPWRRVARTGLTPRSPSEDYREAPSTARDLSPSPTPRNTTSTVPSIARNYDYGGSRGESTASGAARRPSYTPRSAIDTSLAAPTGPGGRAREHPTPREREDSSAAHRPATSPRSPRPSTATSGGLAARLSTYTSRRTEEAADDASHSRPRTAVAGDTPAQRRLHQPEQPSSVARRHTEALRADSRPATAVTPTRRAPAAAGTTPRSLTMTYERPRWRTDPSLGSGHNTNSVSRSGSPGAGGRVSHGTSSPPSPGRARESESAGRYDRVPRDQPKYLIPAQRPADAGKLVVVLDLDETMVYGREGRVHARPGAGVLLAALKGRCEVIVWTAGTRDYALEVIRLIDTERAVQHCIYRHPMWFRNDASCVKDIRLLGRPLETVVFLDNTPEVFRANPGNSLLVREFCAAPSSASDDTLAVIADIFDCVLERFPSPLCSHFMASKRVTSCRVRMDNNQFIEVNILKQDQRFFQQAYNYPLSRLYQHYY